MVFPQNLTYEGVRVKYKSTWRKEVESMGDIKTGGKKGGTPAEIKS